ncbi:MAG: hypothetical protein LLF75_02830 [Eubacteriales bacterium]|nr:hypothetical protein [Eubacteriales bacterium]
MIGIVKDFVAKAFSWKHIKPNLILLVSTIAALCLVVAPSRFSVVKVVLSFCIIFLVASDCVVSAVKHSRKFCILCAALISLAIEYIGIKTFIITWTYSRKAAALASIFSLRVEALLWIFAILGALVGAYAVFSFSLWVVEGFSSLVNDQFQVKQWRNIKNNVLSNWFFPISSLAFLMLELSPSVENYIGILVAFLFSTILSSQIDSLLTWQKNSPFILRIVSVLSAFGTCLYRNSGFNETWVLSSKLQALQSIVHLDISIALICSLLVVLIATPFLYFIFLFLWKKVISILKESRMFSNLNRTEIVFYSILLFLSVIFMVLAFSKSTAFYKAEYYNDICKYDVIYTSDSGELVENNAYLFLMNAENDLRQPLFAIFSAPFSGVPYLISRLISASATVKAILMNSVQIALLFLSNFLISEMMGLKKVKRACFLLLTYSCYTFMLSIVMMEQYIFAFFWLILACYQYCANGKTDKIVFYGAGGTLIASLVLLPTISTKSVTENIRAWAKDMIYGGIGFAALMSLIGRFDVLLNLTPLVYKLYRFSGETIPLFNKLLQYISFIANCFLRPAAGIDLVTITYPSWQLEPVTEISFVGVAILLLTVISAAVNRKKRISKLSAMWVIFSFFTLFVLGWGTKENGLILYSLYFGWAFEVLVFELLEYVGDVIKLRYLPEIISVCLACFLLVANIPAMRSLLAFAVSYYPALK